MRIFVSLAICLSIVMYAAVSLSESDEICCTWVNTNYDSGKSPNRIIFHYDGTYATYATKKSDAALSRGKFRIVEKWKESEGSLWYKILMEDSKQGTKYKLARVSDNGKKLEFVCKPDKYPKNISSNDTGYCNYLRASMDYDKMP